MTGWDATPILTTPRLLLRTYRREDGVFLGMTLDHEALVEDDGVLFEALIHVTTREQWRRTKLSRSTVR